MNISWRICELHLYCATRFLPPNHKHKVTNTRKNNTIKGDDGGTPSSLDTLAIKFSVVSKEL